MTTLSPAALTTLAADHPEMDRQDDGSQIGHRVTSATPQLPTARTVGLERFFSDQWDDWFCGDGGQGQAF